MCRQRFPELNEFDGNWPVDMYYTHWVCFRDHRKKQREKAKDSQPGPNSTKRKALERGETEKNQASSSTRSQQVEGSKPHQRTSRPHDVSSRPIPRSLAGSIELGSYDAVPSTSRRILAKRPRDPEQAQVYLQAAVSKMRICVPAHWRRRLRFLRRVRSV
ncbi:hypothetical protein K438DRAFT_411789 [Mycena galopus ATCC 62051]|nr:hypothetical protein K438DRAFT_411789 [Mycena galopus ATCC 62051]